MNSALIQWLRAHPDNHATFHTMEHDGTIVCTIFWGGLDPDSGAPRSHAIGGGADIDEAFLDALGISLPQMRGDA